MDNDAGLAAAQRLHPARIKAAGIHLAFTYSGSETNSGIKIYIDGVRQNCRHGVRNLRRRHDPTASPMLIGGSATRQFSACFAGPITMSEFTVETLGERSRKALRLRRSKIHHLIRQSPARLDTRKRPRRPLDLRRTGHHNDRRRPLRPRQQRLLQGRRNLISKSHRQTWPSPLLRWRQ